MKKPLGNGGGPEVHYGGVSIARTVVDNPLKRRSSQGSQRRVDVSSLRPAAWSPQTQRRTRAGGTHGSERQPAEQQLTEFHSFVGLFYSSLMWNMCAEESQGCRPVSSHKPNARVQPAPRFGTGPLRAPQEAPLSLFQPHSLFRLLKAQCGFACSCTFHNNELTQSVLFCVSLH